MKAIITQAYADALPCRQPLVGREVTVEYVNQQTGDVIGLVDGQRRGFFKRDIDWQEEASETVQVSFVHFPADKHHSRDTWDMYPEHQNRRIGLPYDCQRIVYHTLALDYGPQGYGVRQVRDLPRPLFETLTGRNAAAIAAKLEQLRPLWTWRPELGTH